MLVLTDLVAPADDRTSVEVGGENEWALTLSPLALEKPTVTVQRANELICAIQPNEAGALVATAFRPLDARSANLVIAAARLPGPDGTVSLRENNWEFLLDQTASNGQVYAEARGAAYLAYWADGLGVGYQGEINEVWLAKQLLEPLQPVLVATQLGVHFALSVD